eukprot:PITA_30772
MLKSLLPGWSFFAIDSSGHSGGLAIGYREGRIKYINLWGTKHVMGMEVISPVFSSPFLIVNIYGPCQGRELFWTDLLAKSPMNSSLMVVGGDLNFSMGRAEAWGPSAREDPLSDFFHKALLDKNLIDPSPIKLKPTWRNRRSGEDWIAKRLDCFLLSEGLISKIPLFRQWVEEVGNSDPFPIFLELSFPPPKPPAPFKFNSSWLQYPSFNNLFKNTWIHPGRNAREENFFSVHGKTKKIKESDYILGKGKASKDRILHLEKIQNHILLAKEEEWKLKSRAIVLKSGDENTSFFHNYAKGRKYANTIWILKDEDGRVVKTFLDLSGLVQRHFQRIFSDSGEATIAEVMRTAQCFPRFIEEDEATELSIPITKEEVEAAMKNMAKDKSPSPDGWTIELFLHFFDLIGFEITDVVEESRLKGEIYRPFNSNFIALIPKKDEPENFEDFRPISLCNCIYKIIANVIAIRIVPILSRNISMEQFGFLGGRQIHSVKQKKKKGVVLKIDLSKAYDRTNWLYLRLLLTHLGFNYSFISWIMGCISNVSFAVLIKGATSPFFKSQMGLRQGSPLSPLPFLLVAEGLSRLIQKASDPARRAEKIKGIEVAINLYITHLLFVDDILIFFNGSYNELKEFKSIFDLFLKATGMQINSGKSQVCVAGFDRRESTMMTNLFPFHLQPLDSPFKYLGFWLKPAAYKKEDWNWLITKLEARISHWSFKWLSRAGRLTLIKPVLLAIPVYWAALTWIPKGVLEKIRRLCFRFLWAGSKENSFLPWVAWDKLARPKDWGGWGIKRFPEFSLSLAEKSGWRLITMETLWTRVVKRKYIDPIPMEDWIRSQEKKMKHSSVIWKATVEAFSVIEQGLAWKVGDGRHVRIGRDPWVGCNENFALSPGLLRHLDSKGFFTLNQVEKVGHSTIWGQAWKNAEDLGLKIRWHNEWASYIKELHHSNVRLKSDQDVLMWAQGKTGEYSPKDGYSFLMGKKSWAPPEWWSKNIWKLKCPLKSRIFLWCMLKRKIPTWGILQARFFIGPGRCPLCKMEGESINHLFTSCVVSTRIWEELVCLLKLKAQRGSAPLEEAWRKWWHNHPEGNLRNLPPIFFWGVWLARNKSVFQDQVISLSTIATNCAAIYSSIPPPESKNSQKHDKPINIQEGSPWAFCDGASQQNRAGAGLCIHLNHDHTLKASVGLGPGSNNYAELSALRLLICWSLQRNISTIQIFGDSMNVVKWVNGNEICQNQILKPILEDILSLKSRFNNFSICHIYRDKNTAADQLSKAGLQQVLGSWSIEENRQGQIITSQQPPFAPPQ